MRYLCCASILALPLLWLGYAAPPVGSKTGKTQSGTTDPLGTSLFVAEDPAAPEPTPSLPTSTPPIDTTRRASVPKLDRPPLKDPPKLDRSPFEELPKLAPNQPAAPQAPTDVQQSFQIFKLSHAEPQRALAMLQNLFPNSRIEADSRTKSILLMASEADAKQIEAVLRVLDEPSDEVQPPSAYNEVRPNPGAARKAKDDHRAAESAFGEWYLGLKTKSADVQSLRPKVVDAFESRQAYLRAQVADFRKRLDEIEETIRTRERLKEQIIDKRVQELIAGDVVPLSSNNPSALDARKLDALSLRVRNRTLVTKVTSGQGTCDVTLIDQATGKQAARIMFGGDPTAIELTENHLGFIAGDQVFVHEVPSGRPIATVPLDRWKMDYAADAANRLDLPQPSAAKPSILQKRSGTVSLRNAPTTEDKRLFDVQRQRWQALQERSKQGEVNVEELVTVAFDLYNAAIAIATTAADRRTAGQQLVEQLRSLHSAAVERQKAGVGRADQVLSLEAAVLRAEQVARETTNSEQPPVSNSVPSTSATRN